MLSLWKASHHSLDNLSPDQGLRLARPDSQEGRAGAIAILCIDDVGPLTYCYQNRKVSVRNVTEMRKVPSDFPTRSRSKIGESITFMILYRFHPESS